MEAEAPMRPPPPRNPSTQTETSPSPLPAGDSAGRATSTDADALAQLRAQAPEHPAFKIPNPPPSQPPAVTVSYVTPEWSAVPTHPFSLEVLKDGAIVQQLDVSKKGTYVFGRVELCDFMLEHPTISRFHAVLQFRNDGKVFIYDCGSTHGTRINKNEIKKKSYTEIHVGDVIRFGLSTRLYIFQGPSELMPPEGDLQRIRDAKARQEECDREASIRRARTEASLAEGISWGMGEDAEEENYDNDAEELTWQNYQGQLTERQEKTRSKIIKRMEKVANMRKEIDAIRVKDIPQGGLTQGQQTQIARNEQRISQIMEELDNLEETLNESIQESLGARSGKVSRNRTVKNLEEAEDVLSDEDDYYDRTMRKQRSDNKSSAQPAIETAETLLDKKDGVVRDMEVKKKLLEDEKSKLASFLTAEGDDLDAYMTGVSSQLVQDKILVIEKDLAEYQTELDRIAYLLKIADPMGEAVHKRDLKHQGGKATISQPHVEPSSNIRRQGTSENATSSGSTIDHQTQGTSQSSIKEPTEKEFSNSKQAEPPAVTEKTTKDAVTEETTKDTHNGKPSYTIPKPQWLGDTRNVAPVEEKMQDVAADQEDPDDFVGYKDRKIALSVSCDVNDLENAAPGLIIRKRKDVDKAPPSSESSSPESKTSVANAVALLLKHNSGYKALYDDLDEDQPQDALENQHRSSKVRRLLGPVKPDFHNSEPDYETWVPPEGQTGDGRTALNDRLGY